jgi:hypothetical protein
VSRPRRPFGPNPPGRLPATLVKVLAAELSDAARLSRGKRYWTDDAVVDLVVGHGVATAEVQGSRPQPYVVTLEARPGLGAPTRREVLVRCTCPDDDGTGRQACKHAVAALFALADEIAVEPEVLARWRRSDTYTPTERAAPEPGPAPVPAAPRPVVPVDELGHLVRASASRPLPAAPAIDPLEHPRLADRLAADVLADALDALVIRWE